ncbi:hypothetical protein [Pseudonocardia cypriaca]|uniref:Uncharacterized protein n=1 Tax=Pseudonocardia cypriaca TaxID=882449 RepID=A0A543GE57_9PSEU|nr:hypothetical protein [Pseudonocardia cypriaca]TQM44345.1 hypothetical protein FB388_1710 [Pseudonocardia cypriaca]
MRVREVEELSGRSGTTRFVLRDDEDNEYTTFRERIGREAMRFRGKRAHIQFHEEERRGFRNVYLDAIAPAPEPASESERPREAQPADESAWDTAVEAAPWIIGTREPQEAVPPEELYERLHPFKELVADDIRRAGSDDDEPDRS